MRTRISVLFYSAVLLSVSFVVTAQAQESESVQAAHDEALVALNNVGQQDNDNGQQQDNSGAIEGTVISASRDTMVVRGDDSRFHLFTYDRPSVRTKGAVAGARVRVTAGPADANGTRVATDVTVLSSPSSAGGHGTTAAAPPAQVPGKVHDIESEIRREGRRWDVGVRAGAAFDPELFLFGVQSRMGPILSSRVFFRPNAEFAFGEVTDLIALNLEGVYQFSGRNRMGTWTPYAGAGPAMIFIHQSYSQGRDINFSNFDYETGFNVLLGMRKNREFVELKSSLWSGPAPKLRIIVGYTF